MARAYLAAPGTKYGPCEWRCTHIDCRQVWYLAGKTCSLCGQVIGFERGFYYDRERGLVHADCLDERLQKEREEVGQ